MKKALLLTLTAALILFSCNSEEHEDYFTEARIELLMPDNVTPVQIQGTLTLQNLNTMSSVSIAEMEGNCFQLNLLRGAYKADVEGMIKYTDENGNTLIRHFRAHADYMALAELPVSKTELPIILLQE